MAILLHAPTVVHERHDQRLEILLQARGSDLHPRAALKPASLVVGIAVILLTPEVNA